MSLGKSYFISDNGSYPRPDAFISKSTTLSTKARLYFVSAQMVIAGNGISETRVAVSSAFVMVGVSCHLM